MTGQLRIAGGRKIKSPKGLATRPTTARVREAVMNLVSPKIKNGNWLDLFSGSGVMGCEALQKGAQKVLAVERDPKTAQICKSNLLSIAQSQRKSQKATVVCKDVFKFLTQNNKDPKIQQNIEQEIDLFDLVYLDPPYGANIYSKTLTRLLEGNWIKKDSIVICEYSSSHHLEKPHPWVEQDRRTYGGTSILLISPKQNHFDDTDSKRPQTDPRGLLALNPIQSQEEEAQSFTHTPDVS